MDCFIGEFITKFLKELGIAVNFKESKDVKLFIINELEKNQDLKFSSEFIRNKLEIICDIFFDTNHDNIKLEKTKESFIISLLTRKVIDIDFEFNKIISYIDKNIIILRSQILKLINDNLNYYDGENPLDEIKLLKLINKVKGSIQQFLLKYKIKKFKYNNDIFNNILNEYKTFDLESLISLYTYLSDFFQYYRVYNLFTVLIKNIANIIENNKIIINKNNSFNLNYIYNLMDENVHILSLEFRKLNINIENINNEIKKLKSDNEKMKVEFDKKNSNNKEIRNMRDSISKLNKIVREMQYDNSKIKYTNLILNSKVEELTSDKLKLNSKVKELKNDNLKLTSKINELKTDNLKLTSKVNELKNDNLKLTSKVNELKNDISKEKMISYKNKKELIEMNNKFNKLNNKLNSISEYLSCPISKHIMDNPVIVPSGNTYDQDQLLRWLIDHDTEPITKMKITLEQFIKNRALKNIIEEFKKK